MRKYCIDVRVWLILFPIIVVSNTAVYCQTNNVWAFGFHAGLNFNTTPPSFFTTSIRTDEGSASISDADGRLLFYTDGDMVWDSNGNLMPDGYNICGVPVGATGTPGQSATYSTTQAAIIVPIPQQRNKFYVFSLAADLPQYPNTCRLSYSIVDMTLNNGLGDIVAGKKGVLLDSNLTEHLSAVKGNQCNIWLLAMEQPQGAVQTLKLKAYRVDENGVNSQAVVSSVGYNILGSAEDFFQGSISIAPDGGQLAISFGHSVTDNGVNLTPDGRLILCDFDSGLGIATDAQTLPMTGSNRGVYSSCFSPDGSKLFAVESGGGQNLQERGIYQYDLSLSSISSIINSKYFIYNYNGHSQLQATPDGKIAFINGPFFEIAANIGAIHSPNNYGAASDVEYDFYTASSDSVPEGSLHIGLPNIVPPYLQTADSVVSSINLEFECFVSDNVLQARDTTGWGYHWNTGETSLSVQVSTSGIYWVSYFKGCDFYSDSFEVVVYGGVLPTIYTEPACAGAGNGSAYAYTYPEDPVNYSYTWMRGSDTLSVTDSLVNVPSGSYSIYVLTDTGCDTLLHFDIPEEDFRVSFEVSDTLICLGDTLHFTNTSDDHFTAFYWDLDNGDTFDTLQAYRYSGPGAYRILLAGAGEVCSDTAYKTILVDQPIVPHFDIAPPQVCVGQPVYLHPYSDSTTSQIHWVLGENERVEPAIQQQYQHAFERPGIYVVNLGIQSRACPDTSYTDSIRVYAFPEVDLGSDNSICLHGSPVYLKNLHDAPLSPYHQLWSTGDTTTILKVVHPGIYSLSVTAGPVGCTTTESIEIRKGCYVDIPNAFTPNGDGNNDYFLPRVLLSESLSRFQMQVFNRWGQLVFETSRLDGRGWDGRFNDKAQPTGVYLYRIEADFTNGRQEQYEGNVTLLR